MGGNGRLGKMEMMMDGEFGGGDNNRTEYRHRIRCSNDEKENFSASMRLKNPSVQEAPERAF